MEKLLAYHGKQEIKDKYVARMKAHIEADELVRGIGFRNGKGCAVGCTLNNYDHIEYETALGFPIWIAKVEDHLFEGMSLEKSKTFPLIFLETIQPGMVLESIKKSFLIYILEQALTTFDNEKFTDVRDSILRVITLYKTTFDTKLEAEAAAREAETAASAACIGVVGSAVWAAEAAGWSAGAVIWASDSAAMEVRAAAAKVVDSAAKAVDSAAWAAEAVAEAVAYGVEAAAKAVDSAAWAASAALGAIGAAEAAVLGATAYDKYADKLIELIKQCTIER